MSNVSINKYFNRETWYKNKLIKGFTLPELLISIGILIVLFSIISINLSPIPGNTLKDTGLDTLLSDIRSQQTLAMSDNSSYGIHFETGSYTLFKGSSYTNGTSGNFVVNLDNGISFSNVTFPNSSIVFTAGSGDVVGYLVGSDSFTIDSSTTGKSSVVKINKYGATY